MIANLNPKTLRQKIASQPSFKSKLCETDPVDKPEFKQYLKLLFLEDQIQNRKLTRLTAVCDQDASHVLLKKNALP